MTKHDASTAPTRVGGLDRAFVERFSQRLLRAWNEHDTTELRELVTDDVVWIDPAQAEPARGVEGVRQFMQDSWRAMPDLHFDLAGSRCFADDAPVFMVPWRMTGTHLGPFNPPSFAPTGRRIDITGADVYTFRGERVVHYRACYDCATLYRQLGLLPAMDSPALRAAAAVQRVQVRLRGPH